MLRRNGSFFILIIVIILLGLLWLVSLNPRGQFRLAISAGSNDNSESTSAILTPVDNKITPTIFPSPTFTKVPSPTPTLPANGDLEIIGYSTEKRPLEVFQFGNGEHHYMIVAGIHGGYEWNTVQLVDELIEKLKNKEITVPSDKTLYILRNLNPDGYAKDQGPDGRANADGVDLNRNWDANWKATWWGSQCWYLRSLSAGSGPGSEPETQALAKFLVDNNIESLISYHSAGLGIFPGGWPKDKDSYNLAYRLSQVSPYSYPPVSRDCEYTGQLIDWASSKGISAVDVELSNHVDTDLEYNLLILNSFLN
jgi:hypothetical protein